MSKQWLYIQDEAPEIATRVRYKILTAASTAALGGTIGAIATQRPVAKTVLGLTANTAIAMAAFAVCQEGVRAARGGQADAWNSFVAGALAGGACTRISYGRGFQVLGAVVWGPLCGSLHWASNKLQVSAVLQEFLANRGLLDLPMEYRAQAAVAANNEQLALAAAAAEAEPHVQPRRVEDLTWREQKRAVEEIKQRELAELHERLKREEEEALQALMKAKGNQQKQQHQQQQQQENDLINLVDARRKW